MSSPQKKETGRSGRKLTEEELESILRRYGELIEKQNRTIEELVKQNDVNLAELQQIKKAYQAKLQQMKKAQQAANAAKEKPPIDIVISTEETTYDDIGGLDSVLSEIKHFEHGTKYPMMYKLFGADPPKGLLMHGPPGCGKTMVAKAMSNELDCWFMELPLSRVISKWVGEAEKTLERALDTAKQKYEETEKKVMVFVDEAEQMFRKRGTYSGHGVLDRCVDVWLRTMDGMGTGEGLIFVAATNRLEAIDDALLRAGRFDYVLEIPHPDRKAVEDIFIKQMRMRERKANRTIYQVNDVEGLADEMYGMNMTGADIAEVLNRAALQRIKYFIETDTEDSVITEEEVFIQDHQIRDVIKQYDRVKKVKKVGFLT